MVGGVVRVPDVRYVEAELPVVVRQLILRHFDHVLEGSIACFEVETISIGPKVDRPVSSRPDLVLPVAEQAASVAVPLMLREYRDHIQPHSLRAVPLRANGPSAADTNGSASVTAAGEEIGKAGMHSQALRGDGLSSDRECILQLRLSECSDLQVILLRHRTARSPDPWTGNR